MLKFYWNGIKDNGGKLQTCSYSDGTLCNHPAGTITIYKREYERFSDGVRAAFVVENDSDGREDYFEEDRIRVEPTHPLYAQVKHACEGYLAMLEAKRLKHEAKLAEKAKRTAAILAGV